MMQRRFNLEQTYKRNEPSFSTFSAPNERRISHVPSLVPVAIFQYSCWGKQVYLQNLAYRVLPSSKFIFSKHLILLQMKIYNKDQPLFVFTRDLLIKPSKLAGLKIVPALLYLLKMLLSNFTSLKTLAFTLLSVYLFFPIFLIS